ncbi:MAG TPA: di-heme oxidoredictase family protein [Rhizomicrobium sp.]|jgi:CxxC motif-containing protein (DUF1111 family)
MVSGFLISLLLLGASDTQALDVAAGKALFERHWVPAPSSTRADEGLGPLYDARACSACHGGGKAGRIAFGAGLLIRLGGDPVYGQQLQLRSIPGAEPEAVATLSWSKRGDLRVPVLQVSHLAFGPLHARTSLRRALDLFGAGLLASIPDNEILAQAQREQRGGVAGRPARIAGQQKLGRFGWKATATDLAQQTTIALERDIGLSTTVFPDPWGDCTARETDCRKLATATAERTIEVPDGARDAIVAYLTALPPPVASMQASGYAVFQRAGCSDCHATLKTPGDQKVSAMTDLLLHDLGPGLDDGVAEGAARSSEWRTAPLWHLADELAAGGLLHDGRARSIAEAVAWHGGQATRSRVQFAKLSPADRKALESFLLGP